MALTDEEKERNGPRVKYITERICRYDSGGKSFRRYSLCFTKSEEV